MRFVCKSKTQACVLWYPVVVVVVGGMRSVLCVEYLCVDVLVGVTALLGSIRFLLVSSIYVLSTCSLSRTTESSFKTLLQLLDKYIRQ